MQHFNRLKYSTAALSASSSDKKVMQSSTRQHGTISAISFINGFTLQSEVRKQEGFKRVTKAGSESALSKRDSKQQPLLLQTRSHRHGARHPEPERASMRAESISRAGTERKGDSFSPTTAQRREDFIHPEDSLLTSLPSPCSPNHQATSLSPSIPAQAHQGLLCNSAQEQFMRVLQNSSAVSGTASPLEHQEI